MGAVAVLEANDHAGGVQELGSGADTGPCGTTAACSLTRRRGVAQSERLPRLWLGLNQVRECARACTIHVSESRRLYLQSGGEYQPVRRGPIISGVPPAASTTSIWPASNSLSSTPVVEESTGSLNSRI